MLFNYYRDMAEKDISRRIEEASASLMSDTGFFEKEIQRFLGSPKRRDMIVGEKYYVGEHDILMRKREVIGAGGELSEVENLPNNRLVDNQFARLVDRKTGYFLGKPFTVSCRNKELRVELNKIFGPDFLKTLRLIFEDCLLGGIGWLYLYYDEEGKLAFRRFRPYEILPFWKDDEHNEPELAVRIYRVYGYRGEKEDFMDKVEIYGKEGVRFYNMEGHRLIPDGERDFMPYAFDDDGEYGFSRLPLIPFKANSKEIPLIKRVKSLQDALNQVRSDFMNNMQEDCRNTILVLKNYDGEDLGEFRRNLSRYGAVKVRSIDSVSGGVDTLRVEVNAENYRVLCDMLKKAITENGGGYDARDERLSSNPNQLNIKTMFSEIDIDTNNAETEFQSSFRKVIAFVKDYLANCGKKGFEDEQADIIFNRDVLINETEAIENCRSSLEMLSAETVVEQHPWVVNADEELDRIKREESDAEYSDKGSAHAEGREQ